MMHNALALHNALQMDVDFRHRLFAVLGSSAALGDHLATHPVDWTELHRQPAERPGSVFGQHDPRRSPARADRSQRPRFDRRTAGSCCASLPETSAGTPPSTTSQRSSRTLPRRPRRRADRGASGRLPDAAPCRSRSSAWASGRGRGAPTTSATSTWCSSPNPSSSTARTSTKWRPCARRPRSPQGSSASASSIWEVDALRPEGKMATATLASHVAYYQRAGRKPGISRRWSRRARLPVTWT